MPYSDHIIIELTEEESKTIRDLLDEAYGALGWLEGSIILSDRARAYKAKKLKQAIVDVKAWFFK